jgi:ABC-2 type transport system permease protein
MSALSVLAAEAKREWRRLRAYWLDVSAEFILFVFGFLLLSGLFRVLAGGNYSSLQQTAALLGFLTWRVADACMLRTVNGVVEESEWGTLEQLWLGPVSPQLIFAARSLITFVIYTLQAGLMLGILAPLLGAQVTLAPVQFLIFSLSQIGIFGVAFALVGVHLVTKSVASLTLAISTSLLFVTGALAPLDHAPWLLAIAQVLPLGPGIQLLQRSAQAPLAFQALATSPAGLWLLGHTLFYALAGWLIFLWGERRARQIGHLAHY